MRKTKKLGDGNRKNMFLPCFLGASERQHVSGGPFGKSIPENRIKRWNVWFLKWGGCLWINNCKKKIVIFVHLQTGVTGKPDQSVDNIQRKMWCWFHYNISGWIYVTCTVVFVCVESADPCIGCENNSSWFWGGRRKVAGLQGSEIKPIACSESRKQRKWQQRKCRVWWKEVQKSAFTRSLRDSQLWGSKETTFYFPIAMLLRSDLHHLGLCGCSSAFLHMHVEYV